MVHRSEEVRKLLDILSTRIKFAAAISKRIKFNRCISLALSENTVKVRLPISRDLHVKVAGQLSDSSNTPMVYDGISWSVRALDGHAKTGIVVFIDVLGMKGMWQRYTPTVIFSKWRNVIGSFRKVLQEGHGQNNHQYAA